jgi:hypothetical protein
MDALINKPTYKYSINSRSVIVYNHWKNCCFLSSVQIQMKKIYPDFPHLDELLNLLFSNTCNVYTHFAYDFPKKWYQIKEYLISKNLDWLDRLDKIVIRMCLPTSIQNQCVLISFIDLNTIDITKESFTFQGQDYINSIEKALTDQVSDDKKVINILQLYNHFEPIDIINCDGKLEDLNLVSESESFFIS